MPQSLPSLADRSVSDAAADLVKLASACRAQRRREKQALSLGEIFANPTFRWGLAGAGLGAGTGLGADFLLNKHKKRPLGSALTGALAGAALGGGLAYGLPKFKDMTADIPAETKRQTERMAYLSNEANKVNPMVAGAKQLTRGMDALDVLNPAAGGLAGLSASYAKHRATLADSLHVDANLVRDRHFLQEAARRVQPPAGTQVQPPPGSAPGTPPINVPPTPAQLAQAEALARSEQLRHVASNATQEYPNMVRVGLRDALRRGGKNAPNYLTSARPQRLQHILYSILGTGAGAGLNMLRGTSESAKRDAADLRAAYHAVVNEPANTPGHAERVQQMEAMIDSMFPHAVPKTPAPGK